MKRKYFFTLLLFVCVSLISKPAAADPTEPPSDPTDVPIDGGLSILLAAGVAYAAKKGYNKGKKDKPGITSK